MAGNGGGGLSHERVDGGLHQEPDRFVQPAEDLYGFTGAGRHATLLKLGLDEIGQNAAEQSVFREQLVDGCRLRMSELSKLLGLGDNGSVRDDGFGLRRTEVARELLNQCRDMIEEVVRREHLVRLDRQHALQPLQPAGRDGDVFGANPFGDEIAEVGGGQVGQGNLFP